ncbi:MAG: UDP-N-acetylmuramoyl-L-alanyl-D-glutamate--2,6-diaminopimelate ligase [Deltaproteobacteria bacterium]|nr:UDP-N-acetylmuramoyl-L-alanyl-D-glutamate--2,6-diaminopimelate ligase [Deltaproteobacteria bacterium]
MSDHISAQLLEDYSLITFETLIDPLPKKTAGNLSIPVCGITCHSKKVRPGFIFAALPGLKTEGKLFIEEAIDRGAVGILSQDPPPSPWNTQLGWAQVKEPRKALARLSSNFYGEPSRALKLIGITGTNGKTTLTYLLESIFAAGHQSSGIIGTINYRYGKNRFTAPTTTPESADLQELLATMKSDGVQYVAMEVSSHALSLDRVSACHFDVACFTNLSQDHLDFHKDLNDYFEAKCRLFTDVLQQSEKKTRFAVLPAPDPWGEKIQKRMPSSVKVLTYGLEAPAQILAEKTSLSSRGIRGVIKTPRGEVKLVSPLIGEHNLKNMLAATACAVALEVPLEQIQKGLEALSLIPGRLEKIQNNKGIHLFVDYAHTPEALQKALETLRSITHGRLIVVFGCGGDRDAKKRPLMGEVAAQGADLILLTSDNPRTEDPQSIVRQILAGVTKAEKEALVIVDRQEALKRAVVVAEPGDAVLVAGKGHEDYQIIGTEKRHFSDQEELRKILG